MRAHLAILRLAALLAPREQREEWFAEWQAELWYVCRARQPATAFCLGAFKDAFWLRRNSPPSPAILRLESPFVCLFFLAGLAAISVLASVHSVGREVARSPYSGVRNLVMISRVRRPPASHPTIRFTEYQSWVSGEHRLFTGLAFYQTFFETLRIPGHATPTLSIARATDNLFQLLKIPLPGPGAGARLILGQKAWQEFFQGDTRVFGEIVEVAGERALVAGALPESAWSLPGRVDAWLLLDRQRLAALPSESLGFVLASAKKASLHYMSIPNSGGGYDYFDCVPPYSQGAGPMACFLIVILMSGLLLPVITSVSLGDYPANGPRWWLLLAAKFALVLLMAYCGAREVAFHGTPVHGLLAGCILAFRWVLVDQRRRCPVCLRLLVNPVRIGRPSQTFLEWYGTELMCTRGHGLLHVTELPTSCYGTQTWLHLDGSWASLF